MDPLSDVLRSVRLSGGVFLDVRFTAPWCVMAQVTAVDWRGYFETKPAAMICYHVVFSGHLLVSVEGEPAQRLGPGEVVLLPRNDRHTLASAPGIAPVDARTLIQPGTGGGLGRIVHGGGGEETHLVCGFLGSDDAEDPLMASLPRLLKLDVRQVASRDWIEASVRFAASELAQGRLPTSSVMSRLSELLFVEAVRQYASAMPDVAPGWLRGLNDGQIGRALALIHQDVATHWSIDHLAREVALSRSAFVDRFKALVGVPPIRYLTRRRMQKARTDLRESGQTVTQLAHAVGYDSEEAFSRAFKREFGLSPVQWRDGTRPRRNGAGGKASVRAV